MSMVLDQLMIFEVVQMVPLVRNNPIDRKKKSIGPKPSLIVLDSWWFWTVGRVDVSLLTRRSLIKDEGDTNTVDRGRDPVGSRFYFSLHTDTFPHRKEWQCHVLRVEQKSTIHDHHFAHSLAGKHFPFFKFNLSSSVRSLVVAVASIIVVTDLPVRFWINRILILVVLIWRLFSVVTLIVLIKKRSLNSGGSTDLVVGIRRIVRECLRCVHANLEAGRNCIEI